MTMETNYVLHEIAQTNLNMTTVDRLQNIYWCLTSILRQEIPGDIVEVGCNEGTTSVVLALILEEHYGRSLHVFDSFQGLPARGDHDSYLEQGDCYATVEQLEENFSRWEAPLPVVHAGWFEDTLAIRLPHKICFAYLDSDFYDSVLVSLKEVWPRLSHGGSIIVDDYGDIKANPKSWQGLPGVKRACDEYFATRNDYKRHVLVGCGDLSFAEFRKR
jgi:O-methyltransferase